MVFSVDLRRPRPLLLLLISAIGCEAAPRGYDVPLRQPHRVELGYARPSAVIAERPPLEVQRAPDLPLQCQGLPTVDASGELGAAVATLVEAPFPGVTPLDQSALVAWVEDAVLPLRALAQGELELRLQLDGGAPPPDTSCAFEPPLAPCDPLAPSLPTARLAPGDAARVRLRLANGRELLSPPLAIEGVAVQRVLDLTGDPAADDGVSLLTPFGQELVLVAADGVYALAGDRLRRLGSGTVPPGKFSVAQGAPGGAHRNIGASLPVLSLGARRELCFYAAAQPEVFKLACYDGASLCQISNTSGDSGLSDGWRNFPDDLFLASTGEALVFAASARDGWLYAYAYDGARVVRLTHFGDVLGDLYDDYSFGAAGGAVYLAIANRLLRYAGGRLELLAELSLSDDNVWTPLGDAMAMHLERAGFVYYQPETRVLLRLSDAGYNLYGNGWNGFRSDFDSWLYVKAAAAAGELCRFDGERVQQLSLGLQVEIGPKQALDGDVYFVASGPGFTGKLLALRGDRLLRLSNLSGDPAVADDIGVHWPGSLMEAYAGALYFSGRGAAGGLKLFRLGGGALTQVSDTSGDPATDDAPAWLTVHEDLLYFVASTPAGGRKLYRLCDPAAGCAL